MAIRRVTRWAPVPEKLGEPYCLGMPKCCKEVTLEWEDGKEEPQVKTRERRIAGWGRINDELHTFFMSEEESVGANKDGLVPATLIIHEPVQEPTLVEAVEAAVKKWESGFYNLIPETEAVVAAFKREKQKSTR
jgi:hypothetical protein